jgi:hypothetical protein
MADYYSILATVVRSLDPNTPAARRRLYWRARSSLGMWLAIFNKCEVAAPH